MTIFQAVLTALVALILTPGAQFYFDVTPKLVVLLAGTAVLVVWQTWRPAPIVSNGSAGWFTLVTICGLLSLAISTAMSKNPALSLFGTNWRRFGAVEQAAVWLFAWLVARHAAGNVERVRTILRGIAIASAFSAAYGTAQYFGWDPILPKPAYHIGEGIWTIVRPPGTLGYTSYFATWLAVSAFLAAALGVMEQSARWRAAAGTSASLSVVAMLLTGTRAAAVGVAAGGLVWMWMRGFRYARRVAAGLVVVAAVSAIFYMSPAGLQMRSRMRWFTEDRWGGGRRLLWRDSLAMGMHRPFVGFGPEVFKGTFPTFETAQLAAAYPDFSYESPHNMLLDALVAQGIPGVVALGAICWVGFRAARRSRHAAGALIAAALAAGVVSQQFTVFTMPTALVIFVTAALAVALAAEAQETGSVKRDGGQRVWALRTAAGFAAALLLLVALRLGTSDFFLARTDGELKSGRLQQAAVAFAQFEKWQLPGTSSYLWYSRECLKVAQSTNDPMARLVAMAQYGYAALRGTSATEEPFDAWYNASQYYAMRGDAGGMETALRESIAARPHWFKPHWALAQLLSLETRMREAQGEAALAARLDGGVHAEVTSTWRAIQAQVFPKETHSYVSPPLHK